MLPGCPGFKGPGPVHLQRAYEIQLQDGWNDLCCCRGKRYQVTNAHPNLTGWQRSPVFKVPTMIIGADVSHPAPGTSMASIAAVSVSMDRNAARYLAGVQTNGFRVEMITPSNLEQLLKPLIQNFMSTVNNGNLPKHVYYFRDGVSEGQFRALLSNEVADIKRIFEQLAPKEQMPQFTVVVAEKRHHIRFFPKQGSFAADRNGNPKPGVLVDKDVTHPFEDDIYLCSHAAIQGTARPTHYQILMDEANVNTDQFQQMLYTHCYQYQRATTPVSLCEFLGSA